MLALRSLLGARVVSLRAFSTDAASSVAAKLNTVSVNPAAKAATAKSAADAAAAAKPVRVVREPLTWRVTRTASKQLPVYSEFKSAGNTKLTVVRRVEGDMWALKDQIQSIVGPGTRIDMRAGSLSIAGNHTAQLRNWLSHLGF